MDTTPTPNGNGLYGRAPAITPNRRAISAEPPSTRRSVHTPLDRGISRDVLNSIRHATPGRSNAPTPHAKAARRALDQRRNAMFTPGKNRRRSLLAQRETPLDILRNLGRALAPKSKPIVTSSSSPEKRSPAVPPPSLPDDDDEFPIDRPRLSLPLDDDDDLDLQPHRSSVLEEGNYTIQSIELPRRAVSEQPSRMSLGVFGSDDGGDFIFNNDPTEGLRRPSDFFPGLMEEIQAGEEGQEFSYQSIEVEPARRMTMGGNDSDFNLEMPAGLDDQTTFIMSEPDADAASTSPVVENSFAEAAADHFREPSEGEDGMSDDGGGFQDYGDYGDYGALSDDDGIEAPTDLDIDMAEDNTQQTQAEIGDDTIKPTKKRNRVSKHGIALPPLPPSFVKKVAHTALQSSGLSNSRISRDTLEALAQASEWFFEQLGDDLGAYANHAKRKTIEESDVVTLMRRQRQIGGESTVFSVAQRHLPRELLQGLRMPPPKPAKQARAKRKRDDGEDTLEIT